MKKLALFLGVLALLLSTGSAYAQCNIRYGAPYCAPNHFARPVVKEIVQIVHESPIVPIVPIAYPVLVPAFQFQYSPPVIVQAAPIAQAYPQAAYPQAAYPQPPGAQTPLAQPPANGNMYGGAPQQDKIKELAKALLDEMRRQSEQELNGDGPPMAIDPTLPQSPNPGLPPPSPLPQQPPNKEQLTPLAINTLSRACAQCHTGIGAKGEVVIFSSPGVFNPGAPLKSMRREIEAGRMPPQYFNYRLTAEELQVLRIWLPSNRE